MGWNVLLLLLTVLQWLIIVRVLMSWIVPPHTSNPLVDLLRRVTDPVLRPIQDVVPDLGGIDISPLVAILAIQLFQGVIQRLLY